MVVSSLHLAYCGGDRFYAPLACTPIGMGAKGKNGE
jgi:hypothetical protein